MKRFLIAAALVVTNIITPALAADVGGVINGGQPGFYGLLDIGSFPPQQVIYRQPKPVKQPEAVKREVTENRAPLKLRVPAGPARHWSKSCREYNASGKCVLFVRSR